MKNLLKVISKDYLEKINIIASEEDDNKQSTEVKSKETDVDEKPVTDVEIGEMLEEETEQQEEIKKNIQENNSDDGTPEEDIDNEDFKSENTKDKELKQVLTNGGNSYSFDYTLQPGEMDRWHITQLKKLKERILKRLGQTEEGDTNE